MTSMDNPKFSFRFVSLNETLNGVNKLNRKKASQATNIPVNALSSCSFPTALKYANIRPAFKKDGKTDTVVM